MEKDIPKLKNIAKEIRKDIIKMTNAAKSGHPGGSLSATDICTGLYFGALKHDPKNPCWEERDYVFFSKGHVAPLLYACLAESGYFPKEELLSLRKFGSPLQGHPCNKLCGVEVCSGSLGQGLSVAAGVALATKSEGKNNMVYCIMGDGEIQEGQIWEAAMFASHYKLNNLVGIVDYNGLQIDGKVQDVLNIDPVADKWRSFGWNIVEIDGHDMDDVMRGFEEAARSKDKPTAIIAKTVKGKGVSFMENVAGWHGRAPNDDEMAQAIKEIEEA